MTDESGYVLKWLSAFLFTTALEVPIVLLLTRRLGLPWPRRLAVAITAQCASHPAVWFIFPALGMIYRDQIIVSEAWALLSETVIYFAILERLKLSRAFAVSLLANGISYALGVLSQRYTTLF